MKYFDIFCGPEAVDAAGAFGWDGVCVVGDFNSDYAKFAAKAHRGNALTGVVLTGNISRDAKRALDLADLVFVDGRSEEAAREASESWDVDLIVNPELNVERDMIHQLTSGLDDVMAAFMAERGIGYCVNFGNILHSTGLRRVRLLGRIRQNIRLASKYSVPVVLSCGATSKLDMRSPHDITSLGLMIGLNRHDSLKAVSSNAEQYIRRAADRSSQDVIFRGLKVKSWGQQGQKPKRRHGWY